MVVGRRQSPENRAQTPDAAPTGDADAADHRIRAGIGMRELRGQPFRRDDGVRVGVRRTSARRSRGSTRRPGGPMLRWSTIRFNAHLPPPAGTIAAVSSVQRRDDADHDGQAREMRRRDDGVDAGGDAVPFVVGGDDHDDAGDPGRCGFVRRTRGGSGGLLADVFRGTLLVRAPHSAHHTRFPPVGGHLPAIGKYTSPWEEVRSPPRAPPRPPVPRPPAPHPHPRAIIAHYCCVLCAA